MEEANYVKQLTEIRTMMDRSSRFVSLSGLSGVLAGIYSVIGAFGVKYTMVHFRPVYADLSNTGFRIILSIAFAVMGLSFLTAVILSVYKAGKRGEKTWNSAARRLIINFCIPMIAGGVVCLSMIQHSLYGLIAPFTLIFYGLALLNASKYTLETVRYLGLFFLVLGLISTQFLGKGLLFWTIGFGGFHIFYGTFMYFKFDRQAK